MQIKAGTGVVWHEDSNDIDFRVESNGNANMLHVMVVMMAQYWNHCCKFGCLTVKATGNTDSALVVQQVGSTDGWGLIPDNTGWQFGLY